VEHRVTQDFILSCACLKFESSIAPICRRMCVWAPACVLCESAGGCVCDCVWHLHALREPSRLFPTAQLIFCMPFLCPHQMSSPMCHIKCLSHVFFFAPSNVFFMFFLFSFLPHQMFFSCFSCVFFAPSNVVAHVPQFCRSFASPLSSSYPHSHHHHHMPRVGQNQAFICTVYAPSIC